MRRTVAAEAGCRTAHAVTFLPLIEAMERGPAQQVPPHDTGVKAPLAPPLAGLINSFISSIHAFGNAVSGTMQESIVQEREQTRSAFEPRMNAAENTLRDM